MELASQQSGAAGRRDRAREFEPPRRATMNFFQRFTFLFSAPMFDADDLEGLRVNQIIAAIERMGFQVIKARRLEDAEIAVQTDAAIGCMVVDWGKKGLEGKAASLINLMRKRGLEMPIMILVRRNGSRTFRSKCSTSSTATSSSPRRRRSSSPRTWSRA